MVVAADQRHNPDSHRMLLLLFVWMDAGVVVDQYWWMDMSLTFEYLLLGFVCIIVFKKKKYSY